MLKQLKRSDVTIERSPPLVADAPPSRFPAALLPHLHQSGERFHTRLDRADYPNGFFFANILPNQVQLITFTKICR